jgi:tRNA dimethylallyltransferase
MEKGALNKRIDMRAERMFKQGLVKEVKNLFRKKLSRTASCAIGIRELKGYFDGEYDLESAKEMIKRNTRLYAKRQLTWFRKDKRIKWINIKENQRSQEVARRILSLAS